MVCKVKTEIAKADVAELKQLFDSVEAQYKRPDMNGDLRLGFASDDFAGTKWKNLTGTTRWSDGTEMVTLDYSHLTSVLWESGCSVGCLVKYSTYSTCSMEPGHGAGEGCIAARRPTVWARPRPSKGRPRCRELLAVDKALKLSVLAHRVLDTLRRDFHEDAALQHRARVREDLVKR